MSSISKKLALYVGAGAMALGGAAPAWAAPVPTSVAPGSTLAQFSAPVELGVPALDESSSAEQWRRRGRRGWRRGRRGIRGGDILAGALIIGGVAAIASAANNTNNRRRAERYDPRFQDRYNGDVQSASNQCAYAAQAQAGPNTEIDRITRVARDGYGWRVEGSLLTTRGYENFSCGVARGRVDYVELQPDFAGGQNYYDQGDEDQQYGSPDLSDREYFGPPQDDPRNRQRPN